MSSTKPNMIPNIGKGDPKSVLINCIEVIKPDDEVFVIIKSGSGYQHFNNQVPFEHLCAMNMLLQNIIFQSFVYKG